MGNVARLEPKEEKTGQRRNKKTEQPPIMRLCLVLGSGSVAGSHSKLFQAAKLPLLQQLLLDSAQLFHQRLRGKWAGRPAVGQQNRDICSRLPFGGGGLVAWGLQQKIDYSLRGDPQPLWPDLIGQFNHTQRSDIGHTVDGRIPAPPTMIPL